MKDNLIALVSTLGGFLVAGLSLTLLPRVNFFLNYRDARIPEWGYLWLAAILVLHMLGVYSSALLLRQLYPPRASTFEPSFLVLGDAVGWLTGGSLYWLWLLFGDAGLNLPLFLLGLAAFFFTLLWIRLACLLKCQKAAGFKRTALRLAAPTLLTSALVVISYSGFPGVYASAQTRQQWAYTEFEDYGYVVDTIRDCLSIKTRVGYVKTVAPTRGKNVTIRDPGSSGHHGEFTLEVVGRSGKGVANFSFHIGTSVSPVKFTHRNKTEVLTCSNF